MSLALLILCQTPCLAPCPCSNPFSLLLAFSPSTRTLPLAVLPELGVLHCLSCPFLPDLLLLHQHSTASICLRPLSCAAHQLFPAHHVLVPLLPATDPRCLFSPSCCLSTATLFISTFSLKHTLFICSSVTTSTGRYHPTTAPLSPCPGTVGMPLPVQLWPSTLQPSLPVPLRLVSQSILPAALL